MTDLQSSPSRQAFILRLDHRLDEALERDVVGIGWARAHTLDAASEWDQFKTVLRNAYTEIYAGQERALGNAAGSIWRFLKDMKECDLVLIPVDRGFFVGEIRSGAWFEERAAERDFAWRRKVEWRGKKALVRDSADNLLQRRLKARQTCVDATDLLPEIDRAVRNTQHASFSQTILATAASAVADALTRAINDAGLEKLIERLSKAGGATAEIQPKNAGKPGDVDVIATYDLGIGTQAATVRVAYQVKQHEKQSDHYGIQQLLNRMYADDSLDRGCFITTAEFVTDEARVLAENNDILVIKRQELIEWILRTGLRDL